MKTIEYHHTVTLFKEPIIKTAVKNFNQTGLDFDFIGLSDEYAFSCPQLSRFRSGYIAHIFDDRNELLFSIRIDTDKKRVVRTLIENNKEVACIYRNHRRFFERAEPWAIDFNGQKTGLSFYDDTAIDLIPGLLSIDYKNSLCRVIYDDNIFTDTDWSINMIRFIGLCCASRVRDLRA